MLMYVQGEVNPLNWVERSGNGHVVYSAKTPMGTYNVTWSDKNQFATASSHTRQLTDYVGNRKMTVAVAKEMCYHDFVDEISKLLGR